MAQAEPHKGSRASCGASAPCPITISSATSPTACRFGTFPDDAVSEAGRQVGALDFVSHSYRRRGIRRIWPYNLFAMVHGRARRSEGKGARIAELLGPLDRGHDIVYSTRILKKTGLRWWIEAGRACSD